MSWFRFVLFIASTWGLLVSVSAHKSTPALYTSNYPDCSTFGYKINENLFRMDIATIKKSHDGIVRLELSGALLYMDENNTKHIVEYWPDGQKYDQKEVKKLPKRLEDIYKKYD